MDLLLVMQKVMGEVVADVAKDSTTVHCCCNVPIEPEQGVCQLPERCCQCEEEGWWHHQAEFIHWEVVVDAVEEEVQSYGVVVIGEVANMVRSALALAAASRGEVQGKGLTYSSK